MILFIKASTALNYFGIKNDIIKNIIDDNYLKVNKYVPGTNIKIISSKSIKKNKNVSLYLHGICLRKLSQKIKI